jgi:predicted RNA-binding Zn ribbon-like protein
MLPPSGGIPSLDFVHTGDPDEEELSASGRHAVRRFRELLTRMLTDEARGQGATEADLEAFDRVLSRAAADRGLVPTVRGYGWGWRRDPGPVTRHLFAPAWSAALLLASDDRHRLKCCDGCGRLFIDRSRNRSRRWCDMERCGNQAKVRRHRARTLHT